MRKLTKKNFERLKEEFVELTRQYCSNAIGGAGHDCVFATMATIAYQNGADSRFTADYYYEQFKATHSYDPDVTGGVKNEHVTDFYRDMGFVVEDLASPDFDGTIDGTLNAMLLMGYDQYMKPVYHSVIITKVNGDSCTYWDSQNSTSGVCSKSQIQSLLDVQYTPSETMGSGVMGSGSLPPSGFSGYH